MLPLWSEVPYRPTGTSRQGRAARCGCRVPPPPDAPAACRSTADLTLVCSCISALCQGLASSGSGSRPLASKPWGQHHVSDYHGLCSIWQGDASLGCPSDGQLDMGLGRTFFCWIFSAGGYVPQLLSGADSA